MAIEDQNQAHIDDTGDTEKLNEYFKELLEAEAKYGVNVAPEHFLRRYGPLLNQSQTECCLSNNLDKIWTLAYSHAMQNETILADVQRARTLDFQDITDQDFIKQCAWAIYGAAFSYRTLAKHWDALQDAYLHWDVHKITAQPTTVRETALRSINNGRKANAILTIASCLEKRGWDEVKGTLQDLFLYDQQGNPIESAALIDWLDRLPNVGPVLATYIAKNIGVSAIKPDIWMIRLSKHLGYSPDKSGVDAMALDFQLICGEKINVIDTVLWNWAMVPQSCLESIKP